MLLQFVNYRRGNVGRHQWFRTKIDRRRVDAQSYDLIANQIPMATMATTMAPHATGMTCLELPLRGESLAAWLNSFSIKRTHIRNVAFSNSMLTKHCQHLVPKRRSLPVAIMF
jgi:hypothetical protein